MSKTNLSDTDKDRIYQLYTYDKKSQKKIAEFYDVSQGTVSNIVKIKGLEKTIEKQSNLISRVSQKGIEAFVSDGLSTKLIDAEFKELE